MNQIGTFVANKTSEIDKLRQTANDPNAKDANGVPMTAAQRQHMLAQATDIEQTWGPGKPGRQILTALTAAAGGNVTGGTGQFAANAAIGYVQSLGANKVKELADSFGQGTPQAESARAALHTIVGCAGAAGGGQGCGSGAMGAAASSLIGSALGSAEGLTEQERQARVDLVTGVVAGIAMAGGLDAATAGNAAKIEGENNWGAIVVPGAGSAMAGGAGQHVPQGMGGYFGEQSQSGDGVIVDNATDLDPSAKAGPIITPNPGPKTIEALIASAVPDSIKQLVQAVVNSIGGRSGDKYAGDSFEKSLVNLPPGERVAQVKQTAQAVAADNGWKKDSQLSRINGRDVYRAEDGNLYAVDSQHGRFEKVNGKTGSHMGEFSMLELKPTKPADTSGQHDLKLK
ncbi:hypothetical protein KTE69_07860 [Burkholderia multivorans]|uniref:colicin E3/pyocin S6 family cytotoxin n=1 Tax=Burkholderia multivorans TaxID=87883 RepID=UPI001C21B55A|nr:hypothetical protein [Burkholderia multivorans]